MIDTQIIHGDCLKVLPILPMADCIFADPPDNLGVDYNHYDDFVKQLDYGNKLIVWFERCFRNARVSWFSLNRRWYDTLIASVMMNDKIWKDLCRCSKHTIIWHYTFGQHNKHDLTSSYRPIVRVMQPGAVLYPDQIRVPSARQLKYKDKRANPAGRVPDDVWEFPRICGTFKEKRSWFPNQHPEDLVERAVKLSVNLEDKDNQLVIDSFGGSGTTLRVCIRLGIPCIHIEQSEVYCNLVAEETGVPVTQGEQS